MIPRLAALRALGVVAVLYAAFRYLDWGGNLTEGDWGSELTEGAVKVGLWVVPCLLVIRLTYRCGYGDVFREIGLGHGVAAGYAFGLLSTLPMFLILPFQASWRFVPGAILSSVVMGPFAEEVLFRGFLFRQLHRRAGWHPRRAILVSGLVFGLAHFSNVELVRPTSWIFAVGEVGITALGGILFAWVVFRWDSLWPAIALHTFMNLSWEIFGVDDWASQTQAGAAAIGPTLANVARLMSIALAVYLTAIRPRLHAREAAAASYRQGSAASSDRA